MAIVADVVTLRLSEGQVTDVYLLDGRATARTGITAERLLAADTAEAIDRGSKVSTLMEGNHLIRSGTRWTFENATMVPCDCDFSRPSWSIETARATIDPDARRISVISPLVRVYHVPILWLPWLSLPMDDRQTGLLMPKPGFVGQNGFSFEQPVFVTLGRSADITFVPGVFTGTNDLNGVKGPRLNTELRYVPSRRAAGRVNLGLLYDFRDQRDPFVAAYSSLTDPSYGPAKPRGLRGEFGWNHLQDFDGGWGARLDLSGHSDGYYFRDITTDVVANTAKYLRSTALLFQRGVDHLVSVDITLRQDVSSGYDWLGNAPIHKTGTPEFGPGTLQRFPSLTASIPLQRLVGPLMFDVAAEITRLSPLFSVTGDEGGLANEGATTEGGSELSFDCQAARLFGSLPSCPTTVRAEYQKSVQGNRGWEKGERERRDRATVVPRLHLTGTVLGAVGLSASAWWRQSVWMGEASMRTWQRGALVVDARAETELGRSFASGWRHVLTPLIAVRAIPLIVRSGAGTAANPATAEPIPYDETDAAIPFGGTARAQAVVELRQRLKRASSSDGLSLDLGQGVDLLRSGGPALSESWGNLEARLGFALLKAQARLAAPYTLVTDDRVSLVPFRLTRVGASLAVDDGKHGFSVAYDRLFDDGTARTRAPMDLLFGDPVLPTANVFQQISGSARWNFGPVALSYSVILGERQWTNQATKLLDPPVFSLVQHTLSVSFTPACDCWRLDLLARQGLTTDVIPTLKMPPDFTVVFTASRFGTFGVSR